ncbi:MAG: efflux RND transporter permease subunit [Nannocystaceae bacterium]|nr:efflux RND transporter permease subunit [Nannocystaceae bacterium]
MFDRIIKLSIGNPVFVNLAFLLIVAAGTIAAFNLPREEFPEISLDRVVATVVYPGATAEDVEQLITKPIEDELDDVSDVDKIESTSQEGVSSVVITFLEGTDLVTARSEVEKAVAAVDSFPDDAENPVVKELELEIPVVSVALTGDPGATRLVEDISEAFRDVDGVAAVNLSGLSEPRIFVDLDERQLRALRLQPAAVAAAIRNAQANVPAGSVEISGQDLFVKTEKNLESAADVARIPLAPGSRLRIGDVADVKAVPEPSDTELWVEGLPAIKLTISREKTADPLGIRDDIAQKVEALQSTLPPGMQLYVSDNFTSTIDDRLDIVAVNALGGAVLVIIVLLVMSGFRQAVLALWGMPISFLMATFLMDQTGLSINVVSTFGLLIAIGIIVDDAIVVIENVQRHMEMGKEQVRAVYEGTKEVLLPVTVAVTTTCLAFLPLTMVSGTMGRIMKILPLVVIFCLIGSLFEAIFILPGHLAEFGKAGKEGRTARLSRRMQAVYRVPLRWCVHHAWITLVLVVLGFAGTLGLASKMPFQVNAPAKPFDIGVSYEIMPGKSQAQTRAQGDAIDAIIREHMGEAVKSSTVRTGSYIDEASGRSFAGANLGKVRAEFALDDAALAAYPAMVRELRLSLATNPELGAFRVTEKQAGPPAGAAVTANVRGRDLAKVNAAVAAVKSELDDMNGVFDIRDDYGSGKETLSVEVDPDRASRYGLTERDVGNAVRSTVDGITALEVSIDEEQVDIVVRYSGGQTRGKDSLADTIIATPGGGFVRLDQLAKINRTREAGLIRREDGQRTVAVLADIDTEVTAPLEAAGELERRWQENVASSFPGVSLSFGGEADELLKSLEDLPGLFGLALILIYGVLALQFRSYLQPLIIISAVPFGLMGAILGLASMGYDLTIFAMFGMVALTGIVVNDSLVMIDFINTRRSEGLGIAEAAIDGALNRLRPIISTTLTTCLGLLPMAIGFGGRDNVLAPMAVSIAGGLFVATILVLLVVPALFVIVERLRGDRSGHIDVDAVLQAAETETETETETAD